MKTTMKSMMIIGMMSLCTVSTFGKTNSQPGHNESQPRQEMRMENRQGNHMDKHHGTEVRVEPMHRHNDPKPVSQPEPRHHGGSDLTTGVVIGTVVGTVLGSLIH